MSAVESQPQQQQQAPPARTRRNNQRGNQNNNNASSSNNEHRSNRRYGNNANSADHQQGRRGGARGEGAERSLLAGGGRVNGALLTATQQRRAPSENDVARLFKAGALIGAASVSKSMREYMFDPALVQQLAAQQRLDQQAQRQRNRRGAQQQLLASLDTVDSAFDLRKTWNQLNLAATALAGVLDPASQILFVASNERASAGAIRAAQELKARSMVGRYVPGSLSNPVQKSFTEPTFIVCASGTEDRQAIKESAGSNTAVIAFCGSTTNLNNIDIPIPCNNLTRLSIGLMYYLLTRQTKRHQGQCPYDAELAGSLVDHFFTQKKKSIPDENEEKETADAPEDAVAGMDDQSVSNMNMDQMGNEEANWN